MYASNCSSSVGASSLSMYKNSVLNSPTPSPPFAKTWSISSGLPMFPQTSILLPDLVVVLTSINFFNSSCSALNFSNLALYSFIVASSGLIIALLLSNWAVSEGVKSWATTTVLAPTFSIPFPPLPARLAIILLETSFISAALSLM